MKKACLVLVFTLSLLHINAANRFATGSGNWNSAIWASSAGGTPGSSGTPTSADVVTINAGESVTVNVAGSVKTLTINGTMIFSGNQDITIANGGSLTVNNGASIEFSSGGIIKGGGNNNNGISVDINAGASLETANALGFTTGTGNTALTGSIAVKPGNKGAPQYDPAVNYTFDGTSAQVTGTAVTHANMFTVNNSSGLDATNNLTIITLTTVTNSTLDMGTRSLIVTNVNHEGNLFTANTSSTPISAGKTWDGAVVYNSASSQNIVSGNYNDINASGGNRILSASDTIGIAGVFVPGTGSYTIANSVIDFNGNGEQLIPAFVFDDLVVSNSGIKKILASIHVTCQTVTINDDASVEINVDGGGKLNVLD